MKFNGVAKDYLRVIEGLFRPPTPPIDFITTEKAKGGSRVKSKRFTDMVLPVPVVIKNPHGSIEDLKEDIAEWLYYEDPKKLVFKQKPDRYYLAEYQDMDLDEKHGYAKGTINFYLKDAHRYGKLKELNIKTAKQEIITGILETEWSSYTKFTKAVKTYSIGAGNEKITLNYNFIVGDVLRIDSKTRDISLNNKIDLDVGLSIDSVWFLLKPGSERLQASEVTVLKYNEVFF